MFLQQLSKGPSILLWKAAVSKSNGMVAMEARMEKGKDIGNLEKLPCLEEVVWGEKTSNKIYNFYECRADPKKKT